MSDTLPSLPLVSVGMPTYNRPVELRRALQEMMAQSYKNLEILVSDNASPGNEVEKVVRELMALDGRIRYFRQEQNRGGTYNFQFVLDAAKGDFFMWAADDDYRAPTYIEVLVGLMSQSPESAIAFCDFEEVTSSGERAAGYPRHLPLLLEFVSPNRALRLTRYFLQRESKGKANLFYGMLRRSYIDGFVWTDFLRRHAFYGADMLFVFWLLCKGPLLISGQRLYRCTVGNAKAYSATAPLSFYAKLRIPFVLAATQMRYAAQYPLIAGGALGALLGIAWFGKAAVMLAQIFRVELMNWGKRVRRYVQLVSGR
jgi:glycosyltransferase involved in cell wall biosynthesis